MIVPAAVYFSTPELRRGTPDVLVYGPAHLFRATWLAGARDYLREPWHPEELFLRLRGPQPLQARWANGTLEFRLEGSRLVNQDNQQIRLSAAEASLLGLLAQRRGTTVSRGVLAWAAGCAEGRVIDTLVGRIRRKLERLGCRDRGPLSVRGLGYRLP